MHAFNVCFVSLYPSWKFLSHCLPSMSMALYMVLRQRHILLIKRKIQFALKQDIAPSSIRIIEKKSLEKWDHWDWKQCSLAYLFQSKCSCILIFDIPLNPVLSSEKINWIHRCLSSRVDQVCNPGPWPRGMYTKTSPQLDVNHRAIY